MRVSASEKLELIRLVEGSSLSIRRTLTEIGLPHDFDVPRLEIKLPDGRMVLFGDILEAAEDFWTQFVNDNGIE